MATAKKTSPASKPASPAAKTPAKTPARKAPARQPAAQAAPAVAKPAKPAKPVKADKPRKPKLVRDSFTIPKAEYAVLDELKQRAAKLGAPAKKSEVLRAGIKALAQMSDVAFQSAMAAVPAIKTGRPGKSD